MPSPPALPPIVPPPPPSGEVALLVTQQARRETPTRVAVALGEAHATLTLLNGPRAGHLHALDATATTIGRAPGSDLVVEQEGISRHHARIDRTTQGAYYAEDLSSTNGTFLGADRIGVALLRGGDLLQLGPTLQMRFEIDAAPAPDDPPCRQGSESAVHDPLTHVFNRAFLGECLVSEISGALRTGGDLTILMLDVDDLGRINDQFGHLAGDRALCTIATRILRALRVTDTLARYGGDEFVVVASGTGVVEARLLAERVLRAVEGLQLRARGGSVRITASIGLATLAELLPSGDPVSDLLSLADERLRVAKATGRNCVQTTTRPPPR